MAPTDRVNSASSQTRFSGDQQPASTRHSWSLTLLSAAAPAGRNRRTVDGVILTAGAIATALAAAVASSAPAQDVDLGQALSTVFGWAEVFWRLVFVGTLLLALSVIVELVLRRRWLLARDVLAALVVLLGLGMALGGVVDSDWVPLEPHLLSQWGFPELRLARAVATLAVSGPGPAQPVRRLAIWLVPLAAVGMVAIGAALPSAALGALALGLGSAALVRLGFGTAAAVPPIPQVRCALRALGVEVTDLRISERQRVG